MINILKYLINLLLLYIMKKHSHVLVLKVLGLHHSPLPCFNGSSWVLLSFYFYYEPFQNHFLSGLTQHLYRFLQTQNNLIKALKPGPIV